MMRVSSAPNLSAVAGTGGGGALLPSNSEKRNYAAIVDGFRQSAPPPSSVKRNRVESVEQPLKPSPPPLVEEKENRCNCVGIGEIKPITLDDIPEYAKQRYLKVKESFGALWDELDMGTNKADDELIGDIGYLCPDPEPYPYLGPESDEVIGDVGSLCPDPEPYHYMVERTPDDILELFS